MSIIDDDVMSFEDMAQAMLSESQHAILANKPEPLREAVYRRVEASLRLSAKWHMKACYGSGIDPVIFDRVLTDEQRILDAHAAYQQMLTDLIGGGASFMVMRTVMGMNKKTFDRIRKELGMCEPSSRFIDDSVSVAIYRKWETLERSMSADSLLQLHKFSGVSISVIWNLLNDWQQVGLKTGSGRR